MRIFWNIYDERACERVSVRGFLCFIMMNDFFSMRIPASFMYNLAAF
jgi:hypothetical protein